MKWISIVVILYGLVLWMGGIIGFAKAHSWVSLIVGSVAAAMLVVAGLTMLRPNPFAFLWAMSVIGMLTVFFTYRYAITQKMMPAGMLALISGLIFCLLFASARLWLKKKS